MLEYNIAVIPTCHVIPSLEVNHAFWIWMEASTLQLSNKNEKLRQKPISLAIVYLLQQQNIRLTEQGLEITAFTNPKLL